MIGAPAMIRISQISQTTSANHPISSSGVWGFLSAHDNQAWGRSQTVREIQLPVDFWLKIRVSIPLEQVDIPGELHAKFLVQAWTGVAAPL